MTVQQPRRSAGYGVPVVVLERAWRPAGALDLSRTLSPQRRGTGDPTYRRSPDGALWRTARTPDGPGTLRLSAIPAEGTILGRAYGPGADWLLAGLPALLGGADDPAGFDPEHPFLRQAARRLGGVRIGRSDRVFEALVPAVLEQKVVGIEARRAWRLLVRRFGEPAPGPGPDLYVPPTPQRWRQVPSWEWHRAGVEGVRARTIIAAAHVAHRLEDQDAAETDRRLRSIPGIGPWTSAEVRQRSHGDPDAVSVGDYHLARLVGWTLVGRIVDDDGMLALLAPYAGHRYRAVRLVELAGSRPPGRGPRMPARDYRTL